MVSDGIGQKLPVGFTSKVLECEELDDYLSSLLLPQALQTIKYLPFQLPASSIKAVLPFLTLCVSMNKRENTPGCKALGLKLDVRKSSVYYSLTIYAVLKFVLPFLRSHLHRRIHHYRAVSDISISEDSYTPAEQLARQRRKQLQELCLKTMDRGIPLLRLFLLLRCWARINTVPTIPNMEKWLAGFQYGSASSSPHPSEGSSIHVLYAHRRWVQRWLQACVPIIALPLLNSARETRDLLSYWIDRMLLQPSRRLLSKRCQEAQKRNSSCPICQDDRITVPFQTNCDHVYCYSCLWDYLWHKDTRYCTICHQLITECVPLKI